MDSTEVRLDLPPLAHAELSRALFYAVEHARGQESDYQQRIEDDPSGYWADDLERWATRGRVWEELSKLIDLAATRAGVDLNLDATKEPT